MHAHISGKAALSLLHFYPLQQCHLFFRLSFDADLNYSYEFWPTNLKQTAEAIYLFAVTIYVAHEHFF
jgi:hypothetical protein